ncbi:hypothetical protein AURDEDRAFT_61237, partial [Auricularia subglabra TFB-10046 SS5]
VQQRHGAMRKLRFKQLAEEKGLKPRNLLRDMPIRWSSTYFMLDRAWDLHPIVNKFIFELKEDERSKKKSAKLEKLLVTDDEWKRIETVREIFQLADEAQQMFAAERYPTLYNAMPAILSLRAAWEKRRSASKFSDFSESLSAALEKLETYVEKIKKAAPSVKAYWVTMVLHPDYKLGKRFKKFWGAQTEQLEGIMEVLDRYETLHRAKTTTAASATQPAARSKRLLDELSDDEDASADSASTPQPTSAVWRTEYRAWLDSHHELKPDMCLVRFWGVLSSQFPTWASLAADYLAVMGSSVSSERSFSSGNLIVTDQRGRLEPDIVEALQSIKCALRNDLLIREPAPSSAVEAGLVNEDSDDENEKTAASNAPVWEIELTSEGEDDDMEADDA